MPPRKEPKETVIYPASKNKVPAFKPLRPSTVPRVPTTGSESSVKATAKPAVPKKPTAPKKSAPKKRAVSIALSDSEEDGGKNARRRPAVDSDSSDSDTVAPGKSFTTSTNSALARRKTSAVHDSTPHLDDPPDSPPLNDPILSQSDSSVSIPQPLLLRLLHEAFADKNTKIDKHAIQVLEKYMEILVRETIARTHAEKLEQVERGEAEELDGGWLELEDLEKVAPGLLVDF